MGGLVTKVRMHDHPSSKWYCSRDDVTLCAPIYAHQSCPSKWIHGCDIASLGHKCSAGFFRGKRDGYKKKKEHWAQTRHIPCPLVLIQYVIIRHNTSNKRPGPEFHPCFIWGLLGSLAQKHQGWGQHGLGRDDSLDQHGTWVGPKRMSETRKTYDRLPG